MLAPWTLTPHYSLIFSFLCGVVGFRIGWRFGNRVVLPLVQSALGWAAFLLAWDVVGPAWAAASVGMWILGTTVASVYVFVSHPKETDERVVRAAPYRASMLAWLETGSGPEKRPAATAASHFREVIWYTAAAIATANCASLAMGVVLLNEMNAYVATLLRAATRTGTVLLLAWNVWSVVRVSAYVLIGAAAAAPVLRLSGWRVDSPTVRAMALAGAIGVVVDLVLKLALSRWCGRTLVAAIDLSAAKANRPSDDSLSLHLD